MSTTEAHTRAAPYKVAHDTFVIPQVMEAPPVGYIYLNSMVIRGAEPVIVDTGTPSYRTEWLKAAAELVEPEDVRWIFLTHDDRDHSGNLMQALDLFPNATLLTTWFMVGRMAEEFELPPERIRFLNDGDRLDLPDRTLLAVRPPLFDNPTTRGLFDSATGVYWSVDTFASTVPHPMDDVAEMPEREWRDSLELNNRMLAPWFQWLDARAWGKHVDRSAGLPIKTIASCHAPAIHGSMVADAYAQIRRLPMLDPFPEPDTAEFEGWIARAMEMAERGEVFPQDPRKNPV